jgi:hypothetical protein
VSSTSREEWEREEGGELTSTARGRRPARRRRRSGRRFGEAKQRWARTAQGIVGVRGEKTGRRAEEIVRGGSKKINRSAPDARAPS